MGQRAKQYVSIPEIVTFKSLGKKGPKSQNVGNRNIFLTSRLFDPQGLTAPSRTIFAREKLNAPDSTKTSRRSPRSSAQICAKSLQFVLRYHSGLHCSRLDSNVSQCTDLHAEQRSGGQFSAKSSLPKSTGRTKQGRLAPNMIGLVG